MVTKSENEANRAEIVRLHAVRIGDTSPLASNAESPAISPTDGENDANRIRYATNDVSGAIVDNALTELTSSRRSCDNERIELGADSMDDPRLEQAFNLIRAVIADADKRAADELVARISGNRSAAYHAAPKTQPQYPDKRAPHGSSQMLIDRALTEAGDGGLTVLGILAKAETEFERMVSASAVRNWLKENERKKPPRYRQVGGVWFLADRAPTVKAVS